LLQLASGRFAPLDCFIGPGGCLWELFAGRNQEQGEFDCKSSWSSGCPSTGVGGQPRVWPPRVSSQANTRVCAKMRARATKVGPIFQGFEAAGDGVHRHLRGRRALVRQQCNRRDWCRSCNQQVGLQSTRTPFEGRLELRALEWRLVGRACKGTHNGPLPSDRSSLRRSRQVAAAAAAAAALRRPLGVLREIGAEQG